ncbi:MAG: DinB family protein [Hyphomonas sp.]
MAERLLDYHLDGLTRAECLWRPAEAGLHIHQDSGGRWKPDWPDRETYDLGPPSIGWITWHALYWTGTAMDRAFGEGALTQDDIDWTDDTTALCAGLRQNVQAWLAALEAEPESAWQETNRVHWPFADKTLADLAAWWNLELMKAAAEIGQLRFLYAARA